MVLHLEELRRRPAIAEVDIIEHLDTHFDCGFESAAATEFREGSHALMEVAEGLTSRRVGTAVWHRAHLQYEQGAGCAHPVC